MRVTVVRHGQSTGNAGEPTTDLTRVPLTALGWQQAQDVAANWLNPPTLIVSSPFLRAQQTAEPTRERFAGVPVEIWPVQEFTYLEPTRWIGTSRAQRRPAVEAYWQRADPTFLDGPGAESFADVLHRAETALARMSRLPAESHIVVFSHGQFMQALRQTVVYPHTSPADKMDDFWAHEQRLPVLNGQKIRFEWSDGRWALRNLAGVRS